MDVTFWLGMTTLWLASATLVSRLLTNRPAVSLSIRPWAVSR